MNKTYNRELGVVAHTFNPEHSGGRGRRISEFEASLVYRVSSRTARATQRNPVSEKKKKKTYYRVLSWGLYKTPATSTIPAFQEDSEGEVES
jgi:hypothetical protein